MKLRAVAAVVVLMVSPMFASAEAPSAPLRSLVSTAANVTARDGSGYAERFVDTRNREFSVRYDSRRRVEAIEATRSPSVLDIRSIKYTDENQLVVVSYRSGYAIFFDRRPNGTEVIRDTNGAGIIRTGQTYQSIEQVAADLNSRLFESVDGLEALLLELGGRG